MVFVCVHCCLCICFVFGEIQNLLRDDRQSRRMWKLLSTIHVRKRNQIESFYWRMSLLEIGRNLDKSQIDFEKKLSPFYLYSSSDKNDAHETNTGEEEWSCTGSCLWIFKYTFSSCNMKVIWDPSAWQKSEMKNNHFLKLCQEQTSYHIFVSVF